MADGWPGWPSIAIVIEHVHPKEKYLRQTNKKKFAGISNHYGRPPLFGRDSDHSSFSCSVLTLIVCAQHWEEIFI
jgi:hypothetical protein